MTQPAYAAPSSLLYDDSVRRLLVDAIKVARTKFFATEGNPPQLLAKTSADLVIETFAEHGFTPNWLLSYHYVGEDANLVKFWYDPEQYPEDPYRQTHVRLFIDEHPEGEVGLSCHSEPNALVHRDAHLEEIGLDHDLGAARAHKILTRKGIESAWLDDEGVEVDGDVHRKRGEVGGA